MDKRFWQFRWFLCDDDDFFNGNGISGLLGINISIFLLFLLFFFYFFKYLPVIFFRNYSDKRFWRFWWFRRDDDDFFNGNGIGKLLGIKVKLIFIFCCFFFYFCYRFFSLEAIWETNLTISLISAWRWYCISGLLEIKV